MNQLVIENGNDLEEVKKRMDIIYDNTKMANMELETAADIQMKTRLTKIKMGLSGIFAAIGYGILGIPGLLITGVAGFYKSFK